MKVHHRDIKKNKTGEMVFTAEEPEDLWHIYNILEKGDHLTASTIRNVKRETTTGSRTTERKQFKITIQVESTTFDEEYCCLSAKGRNMAESEYIKLGQYHTVDLELTRRFKIEKQLWDSIILKRIREATDLNLKAEVGAVVMQEGLAHVCLVLSSLTIVKSKISVSIPQKRRPDKYKEGLKSFFTKVQNAMKNNFDLERLKCIIIASPGFVRSEFLDHLLLNDHFSAHKEKYLSVHSSSGYKHSLTEILTDEFVSSKLADTKAAKETKALERFQELLLEDGDRAFYGTKQVERACQLGAIETLLMCDSLFRCFNVETRRRMVKLSEKAEKGGAEVHIFSSLHPSGVQLANLTGLAAILRYPLPEIEEIDLTDSDDEN